MSLDSTTKLAQTLADQTNETNDAKSNISPDDINSDLPIFDLEAPIVMTGTITITAYTYGSSTFVIDHMVLGNIDSPVLNLDGTYSYDQTVPYPFPITFGMASYLYYTTNF